MIDASVKRFYCPNCNQNILAPYLITKCPDCGFDLLDVQYIITEDEKCGEYTVRIERNKRKRIMKGLIMIGYQGIGKSSCAGKENCIDLESGSFWIGDHRAEDWYIPYCNIALHLANQGYTVFTSSHKVVVDYLKSVPLMENVGKVVVFCPEVRYKNEWIARLQERYDRTGLNKDYKALMNAKDRYTENIVELVNCGLPVYQPSYYADYDLMDYVHKARTDWCK